MFFKFDILLTRVRSLNAQKSLSNDCDDVVEVSMFPSSRSDAPSLGSSSATVPSLGIVSTSKPRPSHILNDHMSVIYLLDRRNGPSAISLGHL